MRKRTSVPFYIHICLFIFIIHRENCSAAAGERKIEHTHTKYIIKCRLKLCLKKGIKFRRKRFLYALFRNEKICIFQIVFKWFNFCV